MMLPLLLFHTFHIHEFAERAVTSQRRSIPAADQDFNEYGCGRQKYTREGDLSNPACRMQ